MAGYTISSGMLYIGENLPPVRGVSSVEPALIQPRLPVDGARPNRAGEGMPYWPAYGEITPAQRAAYLEWLAGGRSDPAAYIGYVFLFFYGIERRILGDSRRWPVSPEERDAIYEEVRRLLVLYSTNNSFRGYATAFLGALWMTSDVRVYDRCQPPTEPTGMELPLLLRLGLGQLARDEQPIPAEWALSWLFCDPDYRQLTPTRRCFDEFRELFRIRYSQVFKTGMTLKPGTRALSASYRPASASFGGEIALTSAGATDVTGRKKPLEKIREVADRCASDLDAYSRWIGRNPERRGSIAAVGLLPSDLLATHRSDDVDNLCAMLEQYLENKPIAVAPASILATSKPVKAEIVATLQLLQKKGYGIEPDVRFGGEVPAAEGKLIVFRMPGDSPTAASPEYRGCALLLHLATVVAAADGEISASELTHIQQRAESMPNLSTAERLRLSAHVRWLVEQPRSPAGLRKRMANLSATQRDGVADFIVAVAGADGRIEAAEVKTLTKLFPILGLDASEVYRRLHALSGAQSTPADVPVSVRPATASRGYAIPPPPSSGAPIVVDMKRVEAKIAETSAVAALLGSIFTGDDDAEPQPTETGINSIPDGAPSQSVAVPPVRNLSAAQSAFVRRLGERMSWARVDVEMLAAELGVMTDGALEAVNEAAFDACGAAVWSGDDPIEMDADVMKELCA